MNKTAMPQSQDWNHFWSLDQTKKFTKISWSKKRIMSVLQEYVKPGGCALDAGCGSGFFSKYFCDSGMKTSSLDYSQEALDIARTMTQGQTTLLQKDLLRANLAGDIDNRFDIIFTDGLFEHFTAAEQDVIFTNLFSLLTTDGVIVTVVPNRFSPWEIIRPLYMPGIEETPFVFKQLLDLNQRNGAFVVNQGGLNTFPFAFSPDKWVGRLFGMLLFTVARKP